MRRCMYNDSKNLCAYIIDLCMYYWLLLCVRLCSLSDSGGYDTSKYLSCVYNLITVIQHSYGSICTKYGYMYT